MIKREFVSSVSSYHIRGQKRLKIKRIYTPTVFPKLDRPQHYVVHVELAVISTADQGALSPAVLE